FGTFTVTQARYEIVSGTFHPVNFHASFTWQCINAPAGLSGTISYSDPIQTGVFAVAPADPGAAPFVEAECGVERPPIPTADLARAGTLTLTLSSDQGSKLGGVVGGKTYRLGASDGPWMTYLRDPLTEVPAVKDYDGSPPNHLEITLDPISAS